MALDAMLIPKGSRRLPKEDGGKSKSAAGAAIAGYSWGSKRGDVMKQNSTNDTIQSKYL